MATIDISGVPLERRTDIDFVKLLADMQSAVDNPKWQAAFAIHEAGHKIYLEKMGITEFQIIPPRIVYDAQSNTPIGYPAAVKAEPVPVSAEGFTIDKFLKEIAESKAAGGVFSRTLTAAPDNGDAEDKSEFHRACEMLREKLPHHPIDEEAIWKAAQEAVMKDLRSPAFRRECWRVAGEIKPQLFGS